MFLLFETHIKVYAISLLHSTQSSRNRASSGIQSPACRSLAPGVEILSGPRPVYDFGLQPEF